MSFRYPLILSSVIAWMVCGSGCHCRANVPESPPDSTPDDTGEPDSPADSTEDSTRDTVETPLPDEMSLALLPPGFANQLMVNRVTLDRPRNRVYTSAHMIATFGEIDLETHELLAMYDLTELYDIEPDNPDISVDNNGILFISNGGDPAMVRFDPSSERADVLDVGMSSCGTALPRDEGGVIVTCRSDSQASRLLVIDSDGRLLHTEPLVDGAIDLTPTHNEDHFAAYLPYTGDGGAIDVYDEDTLEVVHSCTAPVGCTKILEASDGGFVVMCLNDVYMVPCDDGQPYYGSTHGYENRDMVEIGDGVLVADRVDVEELDGTMWSRGRVLSLPDLQLDRSYYTGKNCVSLAWDEPTGQLWLQSEDTGEVWVVDPSDGTILDKIPVGRHPEYLVAGAPGELYFSGRLSTEVSHVDLVDGVVTPFSGIPTWPVDPQLVGDTLWVVDSPTTSLHALDTTTLSLNESFEPEVGEKGLGYFKGELFSGLGWHEGRGTLFLGFARANTLHEVDPATGEVLSSWALSGVENEFDENGIIEVHFTDTAVYALRTTRGDLTRIRLESHLGGTDDVTYSAEFHLSQEQHDTLDQANRFGAGLLVEEDGLFYIAGFALALDDLSEVPGRERSVTQMLGKLHQDAWVAWDADSSKVVVMDDAGEVQWERDIDQGGIGRAGFTLAEHWGPHLIYSSMQSGEIHAFSLAELME